MIEKNAYPHHRVCGEYVSNEVLAYLLTLGIDPFEHGAQRIDYFEISHSTGKIIKTKLPLGGFGISRFAFDNLLYEAVKDRASVIFDSVEEVKDNGSNFLVRTKKGKDISANFVVGAYGKRSNLDIFLNREFISHKSPWLGVKCHYEYDYPRDTVALHNFNGGYCGLSMTEANLVNACYLTTFQSFKKFNNIDAFQAEEMSRNPHLKDFFKSAKPVFDRPLAISQISFDKKSPVENHIFMVGDSAGLIHPLCGNGMAMAIRSGQIFSELFLKSRKSNPTDRMQLENSYTKNWNKEFAKRLQMGRFIQKMLLYPPSSKLGFAAAHLFPAIVPAIIQRTHGRVAP